MKFIGEILGLIRKEEYEKASKMLEGAYNTFLKEDASYFSNIPEKDLTKELLEKHNYTNDHLEVLAELFNTEGELNFAQGNRIRSAEFFRKALILLDFIDKENRMYSEERLHKIEILRKKIEELSVGLKKNNNMILSACGLICNECEFFDDKCTGCHEVKGSTFWAKEMMPSKICPLFECAVVSKHLADCGACPDVPCKMFRDMKDPNSTEEEHQRSLITRVERLKTGTNV